MSNKPDIKVTTGIRHKKRQYEKPIGLEIIDIHFEGHEFSIDLSEELKIDENNLNEFMKNQPAQYAWWASLASAGKRRQREKLNEQKRTIAELDQEARASLNAQRLRVTEEAVRQWLSNDRRVQKYEGELNALQDLIETAEYVLRAFEHRRDMLKEINRARCTEYNFNKHT